MKRCVLVVALCLLVPACDRSTPPQASATPTATKVELTTAQVNDAVLGITDVGPNKWETDKDPAPSTVQIGGRVGPANIEDAEAQATTAFKQKEGTGYLSNSVFVEPTVEIAEAVMLAHEQADARQRWVQEREDGGGALFRRLGAVENLASLGDDSFSASLSVEITEADGAKTKRRVDYVVYRIDRVLAFVVAQNARAAVYAARQERNLSNAVGL